MACSSLELFIADNISVYPTIIMQTNTGQFLYNLASKNICALREDLCSPNAVKYVCIKVIIIKRQFPRRRNMKSNSRAPAFKMNGKERMVHQKKWAFSRVLKLP